MVWASKKLAFASLTLLLLYFFPGPIASNSPSNFEFLFFKLGMSEVDRHKTRKNLGEHSLQSQENSIQGTLQEERTFFFSIDFSEQSPNGLRLVCDLSGLPDKSSEALHAFHFWWRKPASFASLHIHSPGIKLILSDNSGDLPTT